MSFRPVFSPLERIFSFNRTVSFLGAGTQLLSPVRCSRSHLTMDMSLATNRMLSVPRQASLKYVDAHTSIFTPGRIKRNKLEELRTRNLRAPSEKTYRPRRARRTATAQTEALPRAGGSPGIPGGCLGSHALAKTVSMSKLKLFSDEFDALYSR